jgi:phosphatidylethanolamine/phosphatidyl-N-methylethanolamine N-methyltransferase
MAEISPQAVIQTYRRYAPVYDLLFGALLKPGRKQMARAVRSLAPDRLLEVGVGTGLTLPLYPEATKVTGIDVSPEMLARAAEVAKRVPKRRIELLEMDAEDLAFEDNSFDCIAVPYVLSVTPNPERLVSEIRRVCTPDGHILIVNHFSAGGGWWLAERLLRSLASRVGFRSDQDYDEHILSHDWAVLSCKPANFFGLSRVVLIRNVR